MSAPAGTAELGTIVRLEAHAAMRLDGVSDRHYDRHALPVRRKLKSSKRAVFMRSVRRLASYMTMRLNPSYQESHVRVLESLAGLRFEARAVSAGGGGGGGDGAQEGGAAGKLLFSAPLECLVDVTGDSVIEKDTVVFSQLPDSYDAADSSQIQPKRSKKGEIISNLFSAYGEIGLLLTFKASRNAPVATDTSGSAAAGASDNAKGASASRSAYTRVGLRFVTADDRSRWLSFCVEAYMGLLLDSIRTGRDSVSLADPAPATAAEDAPVEEPPLAAIDKYVSFFLAHTATKQEMEDDGGGDGAATEDPPCGGQLRVGPCGTRGRTQHVRLERVLGHNASGRPVADELLVLTPPSVSRALRKLHRRKIRLRDMRVFADREDDGCTFFIERAVLRRDQAAPATPGGGERSTDVFSRESEGGGGGGGGEDESAFPADPERATAHVRTLECRAETFADRRKWLQWLESVLHRPTMYLDSMAAAAAEANTSTSYRGNTFLGARSTW